MTVSVEDMTVLPEKRAGKINTCKMSEKQIGQYEALLNKGDNQDYVA